MTKAQGRRSNKLKGYYDRQFAVTKKNKERRESIAAATKSFWIGKGWKKNGEAVKL